MKTIFLITFAIILLQGSVRAVESMAIIAGKAIDSITIGQPLEDIDKRLGSSSTGDTSMGRLRESWRLDDGGSLEVFCNRPDEHTFIVWKIRTTSPRYILSDRIHVGSSLSEIKKVIPSLSTSQKSSHILEDIKYGISFEIYGKNLSAKCAAISVYKPQHQTTLSNQPLSQQRPDFL